MRINLRKKVILSQKLSCTQEAQKMPMSATDTVFDMSSPSQDWFRPPEQGFYTWLSQESPLTQQPQQPDHLASVVANQEWPSRGPIRKQRRSSKNWKDRTDRIPRINAHLQNINEYNIIIKISCNLMNFDGFQTDHGEVRFIWRLFSLPRWL